MSTTTYLITGAKRGLGLGLLSTVLLRPNTTVVAAVRDPAGATSTALLKLPTGAGSKVVIVKIDSKSDTDAAEAVKTLEKDHSITALDVVIANAGIANYYGPVATTPLAEVREHYQVNTVAPLALFQAVFPLLNKSATTPKFVVISSSVGSISDIPKYPIPNSAYGGSKAALNFITCKIHYENENMIVFPIHPGWVQTDMGNHGATSMGMKEAPVSLKTSVDGMLERIDNATREKTSGTFQSFDAEYIPW